MAEPNVLIIVDEHFSERLAGRGVRYCSMAAALTTAGFPCTLMAPGASDHQAFAFGVGHAQG